MYASGRCFVLLYCIRTTQIIPNDPKGECESSIHHAHTYKVLNFFKGQHQIASVIMQPVALRLDVMTSFLSLVLAFGIYITFFSFFKWWDILSFKLAENPFDVQTTTSRLAGDMCICSQKPLLFSSIVAWWYPSMCMHVRSSCHFTLVRCITNKVY